MPEALKTKLFELVSRPPYNVSLTPSSWNVNAPGARGDWGLFFLQQLSAATMALVARIRRSVFNRIDFMYYEKRAPTDKNPFKPFLLPLLDLN